MTSLIQSSVFGWQRMTVLAPDRGNSGRGYKRASALEGVDSSLSVSGASIP